MSDITINYKGSAIATMDASGTKTLLTEGKYCEDDIEVVYVSPGGGGGGNVNITQDANGSLVIGKDAPSRGGGSVVDTTIEIGENSVANASTVFDYLTTAVNVNALLYVELVETPDANNQLVKYPASTLKSPANFTRYRNGSVSSTGGAWQPTYDLTLKQGTHYRVMGVTYTVPA